jgi:hypothetical protein
LFCAGSAPKESLVFTLTHTREALAARG